MSTPMPPETPGKSEKKSEAEAPTASPIPGAAPSSSGDAGASSDPKKEEINKKIGEESKLLISLNNLVNDLVKDYPGIETKFKAFLHREGADDYSSLFSIRQKQLQEILKEGHTKARFNSVEYGVVTMEMFNALIGNELLSLKKLEQKIYNDKEVITRLKGKFSNLIGRYEKLTESDRSKLNDYYKDRLKAEGADNFLELLKKRERQFSNIIDGKAIEIALRLDGRLQILKTTDLVEFNEAIKNDETALFGIEPDAPLARAATVSAEAGSPSSAASVPAASGGSGAAASASAAPTAGPAPVASPASVAPAAVSAVPSPAASVPKPAESAKPAAPAATASAPGPTPTAQEEDKKFLREILSDTFIHHIERYKSLPKDQQDWLNKHFSEVLKEEKVSDFPALLEKRRQQLPDIINGKDNVNIVSLSKDDAIVKLNAVDLGKFRVAVARELFEFYSAGPARDSDVPIRSLIIKAMQEAQTGAKPPAPLDSLSSAAPAPAATIKPMSAEVGKSGALALLNALESDLNAAIITYQYLVKEGNQSIFPVNTVLMRSFEETSNTIATNEGINPKNYLELFQARQEQRNKLKSDGASDDEVRKFCNMVANEIRFVNDAAALYQKAVDAKKMPPPAPTPAEKGPVLTAEQAAAENKRRSAELNQRLADAKIGAERQRESANFPGSEGDVRTSLFSTSQPARETQSPIGVSATSSNFTEETVRQSFQEIQANVTSQTGLYEGTTLTGKANNLTILVKRNDGGQDKITRTVDEDMQIKLSRHSEPRAYEILCHSHKAFQPLIMDHPCKDPSIILKLAEAALEQEMKIEFNQEDIALFEKQENVKLRETFEFFRTANLNDYRKLREDEPRRKFGEPIKQVDQDLVFTTTRLKPGGSSSS